MPAAEEQAPAPVAKEQAPQAAVETTPEPPNVAQPSAPEAPEPPALDPKLLSYDLVLQRIPSMSVREFAKSAGVAESTARSSLKKLVEIGLADVFKQGRSHRYWSHGGGLRPDIGLSEQVKTISAVIERDEAERIGQNMRETKLLGMLGDDEELVDATLEHRALFRLSFQEKVKRSFWKRLVSSHDFEHRAESVYLHTRTLQLVVFHPSDGMFLHDRPEDLASDIEDFDGVARFEQRPPGELAIDEHEWRERRDEETVIAHFSSLYHARPKSIEPVFLPLWRLHLRRPGRPGTRIVTIDALSGYAVDW
jgi:DNA-binding transcriptional ArsR family regulator